MHVKHTNEINADFLRYMVLNSIRSNNMKHFKGQGEIVIACDSKNNWRKDVFPFYKAEAARKVSRDASTLNWEKIFESFDVIRSELKEFFPYTVLDVERAEADDIIATLCINNTKNSEKTLILSGDTDFVQLHDNFFVDQYDPVRKKKIQFNDPELYLRQHIIEGDKSDGIPNICSEDNCFVLNKRQRPMTKKRKDYLLSIDVKDYPSVEKRNYHRNKQLIDLTMIPEEIKLNINMQYANKPIKNKSKLFNYFYDRKLTKFIDLVQEF